MVNLGFAVRLTVGGCSATPRCGYALGLNFVVVAAATAAGVDLGGWEGGEEEVGEEEEE